MKMLDVFAGLGGMSESFLMHGWEVHRIDNNMLLKSVPNMTIQDVRDFVTDLERKIDEYGIPEIDYVHLSPPCLEFSTAYNAPGPTAQRENREFIPSLELVEISIKIVKLLQPRYWSLENVKGSIKHLKPLLGEPRQIVDSMVFWGSFPIMDMGGYKPQHKKDKYDPGKKNPLRANYRALIPYDVSNRMRIAIESQKQLTYWF